MWVTWMDMCWGWLKMIQLKMHSVMYVPSPGGDMEGFLFICFSNVLVNYKNSHVLQKIRIYRIGVSGFWEAAPVSDDGCSWSKLEQLSVSLNSCRDIRWIYAKNAVVLNSLNHNTELIIVEIFKSSIEINCCAACLIVIAIAHSTVNRETHLCHFL